jgi:hypothetical protein
MKFCNLCGANLSAVRQVFETREAGETGEKFDWSKTWVAEMFLSEDERKRRKAEFERQQGITPDVKRSNEVKGGVITSCVGVALMIFLFVFMSGLIKSGIVDEQVAEILRHVWVAGVIPFFVGIGLMINGLFVSKHLNKARERELAAKPNYLESDVEHRSLRSADTNEFITPDFSVTEGTTKHLSSTGQKR